MNSSRFFSLIAGVCFLAVCAYAGAAIYSQVDQPDIQTVQTLHIRDSAQLQGIVLRSELSLRFDRGTEPLAQDAKRLAAGETLALDAKGAPLRSPCSAVYFSDTDGYEHLSIASLEPLSVQSLKALLSEKPLDQGDGRLVTGQSWYFAALAADTQALPEKGSCSVQFDALPEAVPAQIIAVSEPEDGKRAMLLRLNQGGSEYLSLRKTGASLLFSEYTGLYLPQEAIEQAEDGTDFVYTISAGVVETRPVELIYKGSGFSLAAISSQPDTLREGDRIVMGKDIYKGKVLVP